MSTSRILIVEDNLIAAKVLQGYCQQLSCPNADHASSCQAAKQYLEHNSYGLIFMDLGLADGDGIALTRLIRSTANANQHVPIVVVSAHVDEKLKTECLQAGANEVYVKPLAREKMQQLLEGI